MRDGLGRAVPCEVLPKPKMEYTPDGRPALTPTVDDQVRLARFAVSGDSMLEKYTYTLSDAEESVKQMPGRAIENEFLSVTLRGNTIDLMDKQTGITYRRLNRFIEFADAGDIWDYSDTWEPSTVYSQDDFEITEACVTVGSFSSALTYRFDMLLPEKLADGRRSGQLARSAFCVTVTLYRGIRRADVKVTVENRSKDHGVRLQIPDVSEEQSVLTGGLFTVQHLDPGVYLDCKGNVGTAANRELPFRDFVSYQNGAQGLAVAFKGLYTYEYKDNALEIPLFRCVGRMTRPNMKSRTPGSFASSLPIEDAQCIRQLSFEFSLLPLDRGRTALNRLDDIYSYLRPPFAHTLRYVNNGSSPRRFDPVRLQKTDNILVSVLRKAFDGQGAILRVYEAAGKAGHISLSGSVFSEYALTTMNEDVFTPLQPDSAGVVQVDIPPHKIVTIRMK